MFFRGLNILLFATKYFLGPGKSAAPRTALVNIAFSHRLFEKIIDFQIGLFRMSLQLSTLRLFCLTVKLGCYKIISSKFRGEYFWKLRPLSALKEKNSCILAMRGAREWDFLQH